MKLYPEQRMHRRLVRLVRAAEAEKKRHDRAIAAFRKTHSDFDALLPAILELLRTGAVPVSGDTVADLKRAYRAAQRQQR